MQLEIDIVKTKATLHQILWKAPKEAELDVKTWTYTYYKKPSRVGIIDVIC